MRETWVWSLGQEDPLEKEMATHSSILAWIIPWTKEPGRLQSMGSQRVGHNWVTSLLFPVFLPGQGQRSLAGYSPWCHKSQTRLSDYTITTALPHGCSFQNRSKETRKQNIFNTITHIWLHYCYKDIPLNCWAMHT